jgi:hypothetical protein
MICEWCGQETGKTWSHITREDCVQALKRNLARTKDELCDVLKERNDLVAKIAQLEAKDSIKTQEINVLMHENKALATKVAELERELREADAMTASDLDTERWSITRVR